MIPQTLVLKPGLVVHSVYDGYWFWGRPSVEDLRQDLRAVSRERADCDLSAAGLASRGAPTTFRRFTGGTGGVPNGSQARARIAG